MAKEKDLFDESTMSFGEHLEELRKRIILALLGLMLGVLIALFFSNHVMKAMQYPVKRALTAYYNPEAIEAESLSLLNFDVWGYLFQGTKKKEAAHTEQAPVKIDTPAMDKKEYVNAEVNAGELLKALHEVQPAIPAPKASDHEIFIPIRIAVAGLKEYFPALESVVSLTTLTPEEAFLVYMKVAMVTGLVLSSPWVFFQLWLFVAAGLYPHERKYIYIYLPLSLFLFLGGAVFCFYAVIPFVLKFLFDFNRWLEIAPQIRVTEWISFAVTLPVMFGISFQLPLVMLFLERINVLTVAVYQEKRKLAILTISFISMILTPSDPVSMLLMMIPLCILYELGIVLCKIQTRHSANPFVDSGKSTGLSKS